MVDKSNIAEVYGKTLSISTKISIEICNAIRGKELSKAKKFLQDVIDMKRALALKRFNADQGHKPGKIAAGRYPINASKVFLGLLNSVEANASNKGLDVNSLFISFAKADRAERRWHSSRGGRVEMKITHVKIQVEERKKEKKENKK